MNRKWLLLLVFTALLTACQSSRDLDVDVSQTEVDAVEIRRYEKAVFKLNPDFTAGDVVSLHEEFPFFVDEHVDSAELYALREYVNDPVNRDLYLAVKEKYPETSDLENQLRDMFRHMKYYFPRFKPPTVYSYVSSLSYDNSMIYRDSVMVIGLDMFLGKEASFYNMAGFPRYVSRWFVSERIVPAACNAMVSPLIPQAQNPSLLDYMVQKGKLLYLMDAMMPQKADKYKIRYTDAQIKWIEEYEVYVWGLIVDKDLLFSKERPKIKSFIDDAPFTSTISKEAPPRLAEWLGWQLIRKYMDENTGVSIQELIRNTNHMEILKKSRYKPAQKARR